MTSSKPNATRSPYPVPVNKGTGPDHPWRGKTTPVSARVAMRRGRKPQPSRLSPKVREILERTRRAMARQ